MRHLTRPLALIAVLALVGLGSGACGDDTAEDPGPSDAGGSSDLAGDYVSAGLPDPPFDDGSAPVRLTLGDDGTLAFTASCNHYSGNATWDDGVLRADSLGGTEMGCDEALMAQDEWLVDLFTSDPEIAVDGTDLRIGSGEEAVWFVPADETDEGGEPGDAADLVGPTWTLTGIGETDGDSTGMMVIPDDVTATIRFTDGGEVQVEYGCNTGGGSYRVAGQVIRFGQMMSSLMACDDARGEVERGVQQVLMSEQPVAWSIAGDELRLTSRDGRHELVYAG